MSWRISLVLHKRNEQARTIKVVEKQKDRKERRVQAAVRRDADVKRVSYVSTSISRGAPSPYQLPVSGSSRSSWQTAFANTVRPLALCCTQYPSLGFGHVAPQLGSSKSVKVPSISIPSFMLPRSVTSRLVALGNPKLWSNFGS